MIHLNNYDYNYDNTHELKIYKTIKINYLMYMKDTKLFANNEKELEIKTIVIYSQDIGMEFVLEKCAKFKMESGKRQRKK